MEERERVLRLFAIDDRDGTRAPLIVDRLRAARRVDGDGPWTVSYEDLDTSEAMTTLGRDLATVDPTWWEVLDFEAVPSVPLREVDFS
ncbi:MAG TPA: hypothetical protein VHV53_07350 [Solirubrobacterales bacterium]|jgi:hypothetical protein|nr:hypothetical protein [Solirubrobacterales bacterium]